MTFRRDYNCWPFGSSQETFPNLFVQAKINQLMPKASVNTVFYQNPFSVSTYSMGSLLTRFATHYETFFPENPPSPLLAFQIFA
jgi:hypothetical protein